MTLNALDFVDTGMQFKYYAQPAAFTRSLSAAATARCSQVFDSRCATGLFPTGGVDSGGTSVTVFGAGFDAFTSYPALASCWFGSEVDGITTPLELLPTQIVCPAPRRGEADGGVVSLRIALNGVHFADTGHQYMFYTQPTNFSAVMPTGGALATGTTVTIFGEGAPAPA